MKSILMSIKPKWIEKIASGEKTVEVRKTVPKGGAPFKVYMYCTYGRPLLMKSFYDGKSLFKFSGVSNKDAKVIYDEELWNGKVVGEFVCDEVIEAVPDYEPYFKKFFNYDFFDKNGEKLEDCLTDDEKVDYANEQTLYGLHISDLKIYDKPKELGEFYTLCDKTPTEITCRACSNNDVKSEFCFNKRKSLTRPPQSWQFVMEKSELIYGGARVFSQNEEMISEMCKDRETAIRLVECIENKMEEL